MQPPIVWMASNSEVMQDSQGTEVSGAKLFSQDSQGTEVSGVKLFSQQSSVASGKATAESDFQGTSSSSELGIQIASPEETQEEQSPHSGVPDQAAISEQSPAATDEGDNPVEQDDEEDEVRLKVVRTLLR